MSYYGSQSLIRDACVAMVPIHHVANAYIIITFRIVLMLSSLSLAGDIHAGNDGSLPCWKLQCVTPGLGVTIRQQDNYNMFVK